MKQKYFVMLFVILLSLSSSSYQFISEGCIGGKPKALAFLTIRTESGEHFDSALFIAKYLKYIGIKVRIQVKEWDFYDNLLISQKDFDLAILEIKQELNCSYGEYLEIFSEDGILGNFGWKREIPYCNQSEYMLKSLNASENTEEELDLLYDWITMMMDNIVPILPLYVSKNDSVNLLNYSSFETNNMAIDFSADTSSIVFLVFNLLRPFVGGADNYEYMDVPGKEEYTKGVGVRKAISYCIDKDEMNNIVNSEFYSTTSFPIIRSSPSIFETGLEFKIKYNTDLEKAQEWIEYSGYGLMHECGPENMSLNFNTTALTILAVVILIYICKKKKRRKRISAWTGRGF
ncbi:MAG: hypothetical protein ACXAAM_06380 [Candidatus Heimdallarchaeaceae archaeon]|jgi:ABC-type transport system substrate-binding protein